MLSDDVDNEDEDGQRRYKRQIPRELYAGMHNRCIRTWNGGYVCPFCNQNLHDAYLRVLVHARGQAVGSFKQKFLAGWRMARTPSTWRSFRIVPACEMRCGMDRTMYAWVCLMTVELRLCTCTLIIYVWVCLIYVYLCLTVGYGCNQFGWWNLPLSSFIGPLRNLC